MPKIEFKVGNQFYDISCGEGEEDRIRFLAEQLNSRVEKISQAFSSASDNMILAITALMMEDELQSKSDTQESAPDPQPSSENKAANQNDIINTALADAIEPIAEAIETLARKLEK